MGLAQFADLERWVQPMVELLRMMRTVDHVLDELVVVQQYCFRLLLEEDDLQRQRNVGSRQGNADVEFDYHARTLGPLVVSLKYTKIETFENHNIKLSLFCEVERNIKMVLTSCPVLRAL